MQAVPDRCADVRLVEVLGGVLARYQGVIQPAGDDHAATPGTKPAPVVRLVVPGRYDSGARQPAERPTAQFAPPDVETAVDEYVECEPGPGAELQHPDTATLAVTESDQPYPGDLFQAADAPEQVGPAVG